MRRIVFLAAVLFALPPASHAQIFSVYGTFSPVHVSGVSNSGNAQNLSTATFWAEGVGAGATLNFLPIGPIKLGFDLRGSTRQGGNGADLVLAGLRLGVKAPFFKVKPYIQASAGYFAPRPYLVNSPLPAGTVSNGKYVAYEILGGIDYPLIHFVDLRVIEIGGGQAYSTGTTGTSGNQPSLFTIGTGAVVHF